MKSLINKSIFILSLLVCSSALADSVRFSTFNIKPLYKEPFASLRTPDTGVTINTSKYQGQRVGYLEASLGKNAPIITAHILSDFFNNEELTLQLGLAGGFWATLGYDKGAFPLLTEDFLISVPLEFRWGEWSGAIKYNHISAHLGDGFDKLLEEDLSSKDQKDLDKAESELENLSNNKDIGIILTEPFSYSRDFISLHIAYNYKIGVLESRKYAHIGYSHKMVPSSLRRWFMGSGAEIIYPSKILAPYLAQDVTWHDDTDSVDLSMELGVIILPGETKYYTLRVALTGYMGTDRRGQLVGNKLKQLGFGFFIY